MAVQGTLGTECVLSIDGTGTVMPAVLNSCSPDVQLQLRTVLAAMGQRNALLGYAPSANARSGFMVTCKIPRNNGLNQISRVLEGGYYDAKGNAVAPMLVMMQFGNIGKIQIPGCIAFTTDIRGTEGQDLTCQLTFESASFPDNPGGAGNYLDVPQPALPAGFGVWAFSDVTAIHMLAAEYTLVNSFSVRVQRQQAKYTGNSKTGIAQQIGVGYQEVLFDAEYLKIDDKEVEYFITGGPGGNGAGSQTPGLLIVSLAATIRGNNYVGGLSADSCVYEQIPKNAGSETEWLREAVTGARSMTGLYTIFSQP